MNIKEMEFLRNFNDQGEMDGGWSILEGDVEGSIRRALLSGFRAWDSYSLTDLSIHGNEQGELEVRFKATFTHPGRRELHIVGVAKVVSSLRPYTNSFNGKEAIRLYTYIHLYWDQDGK